MANKVVTVGAFVAGGLAAVIGLLVSPLPANLGLYRWLATQEPKLTGLFPAFVAESQWIYTFEQLYNNPNKLSGETALVTGSNSGLGYEVALALARLGVSVTMACRNLQLCEAAAATIRSDTAFKGKVSPMRLDTSSLKSVKNFAEKILETNTTLDLLYLNAGIVSAGFSADGSAPQSEDGIETVFATNHVGHHLLYKLLEPLLLQSKMARVVLTSSSASFETFSYKVATDRATLNSVDVNIMQSLKIYGQSKLAQILFAKELTRRLGPDSNIYVNAAHPGAVNTPIWRKNPLIPDQIKKIISYLGKSVMWNPTEGALTLLHLGVATEQLKTHDIRGKYFHPQSQEVVNPLSLNETLQKEVWAFSDDLVKDFL